MEFYTIYAEKRIATENDHREGPFMSFTEANHHLFKHHNFDCVVIAFLNHRWHQVEYAEGLYLCKPLNDPTAYWDILDYKEE